MWWIKWQLFWISIEAVNPEEKTNRISDCLDKWFLVLPNSFAWWKPLHFWRKQSTRRNEGNLNLGEKKQLAGFQISSKFHLWISFTLSVSAWLTGFRVNTVSRSNSQSVILSAWMHVWLVAFLLGRTSAYGDSIFRLGFTRLNWISLNSPSNRIRLAESKGVLLSAEY